MDNLPKRFPEVFPRFFSRENNGLNGTSELFPGGVHFPVLMERVGVVREKLYFLIYFLFLIDLKLRENLGKSFPEVPKFPKTSRNAFPRFSRSFFREAACPGR